MVKKKFPYINICGCVNYIRQFHRNVVPNRAPWNRNKRFMLITLAAFQNAKGTSPFRVPPTDLFVFINGDPSLIGCV